VSGRDADNTEPNESTSRWMDTSGTLTYLPPLAAPHEHDGIGDDLQAVLQELLASSLTRTHRAEHVAPVGPVNRTGTTWAVPGVSTRTTLPSRPSPAPSSRHADPRPSQPARTLPRWRTDRPKVGSSCGR
jgi:hypothetical protein